MACNILHLTDQLRITHLFLSKRTWGGGWRHVYKVQAIPRQSAHMHDEQLASKATPPPSPPPPPCQPKASNPALLMNHTTIWQKKCSLLPHTPYLYPGSLSHGVRLLLFFHCLKSQQQSVLQNSLFGHTETFVENHNIFYLKFFLSPIP